MIGRISISKKKYLSDETVLVLREKDLQTSALEMRSKKLTTRRK